MSMNPKLFLILGFLLLASLFLRAEDYLKEAQDERSASKTEDSPLAKMSLDHRIKDTLLYIGPISDSQVDQPFILIYLAEDCRTDEELAKYTDTHRADGPLQNPDYIIEAYPPEVKDHLGHPLARGSIRVESYKDALAADFQKRYPGIKLPTPVHPEHAFINEFFYATVETGPFDIILHDSIKAWGPNDFHFRNIDANRFSLN